MTIIAARFQCNKKYFKNFINQPAIDNKSIDRDVYQSNRKFGLTIVQI